MTSPNGPLRVGVGGPVGSGKTALMDTLCKRLRERYDIAAITNDIYTKEDAEFLTRSGALAPERILGVETGGCPHTAIREDASINLAAVADLNARFPALDVVLIESGGDNLAATFSPELADITIYVIDVAAGDKIPRKGGPGITRSDLLVINKIDLAPMVGASLEVMDRDARKMRGSPAVRLHQHALRRRPGGRQSISSSKPADLQHEDHRHQAVHRLGRQCATSSSSRSRPTRASTAGASRASPAARRRSSARRALRASSSSGGPDADRRALAGDVPQPVFRGRAGAARPPSPPSTSRSTTSAARRWASRSTNCSAASSATASRLRHDLAEHRAEDDRGGASSCSTSAGPCIRLVAGTGHDRGQRVRAARSRSPKPCRG